MKLLRRFIELALCEIEITQIGLKRAVIRSKRHGNGILLLGIFVAPEPLVYHTQCSMDVSSHVLVVLFGLQRLTKFGFSIIEAVQVDVSCAELQAIVAQVFDLDGAFQLGTCLLVPASPRVRNSEHVVGIAEIVVECDGVF